MEKSIAGTLVIDPIDYYAKILSSDRNSAGLHFIPVPIAKELSENKELAQIMCTHPYYNIRSAYALVAINLNHIETLSNDDWRVRANLPLNPNVPMDVIKRLAADKNEYVSKAANLRLNPPAEYLRK